MENENEIENKFRHDIENIGWTVALFEASEYFPSFGYTIGLWENYKHPELIIFGLNLNNLNLILNIGGELVKSGQRLNSRKTYSDFFNDSNAYILDVHENSIKDYFGYGLSYTKDKFTAQQIVWTDRNEKFPWEDDFEKVFEFKQPLLDRNHTFKFREPKNLGVFTTKSFVNSNKPILYVQHDFDGDWQFLTGESIGPKDGAIVSLESMTKADFSLNELFNLDYGECAERESIKDNWVRDNIK